MKEKPQAMVLASFAADSLALGVHWIYNTHVIDKKFGRVEHYIKPERPTYHPTKKKRRIYALRGPSPPVAGIGCRV